MKKQCVECKKWFTRIDVYKINESWIRSRYACKTCLKSHLAKNSPSPPSKYERTFWTCAICQQKFSDRNHYLSHGCHFR